MLPDTCTRRPHESHRHPARQGGTLFTVSPDQPLMNAVTVMSEHDIGSLVVMEHGDLVGMLTFREVIRPS